MIVFRTCADVSGKSYWDESEVEFEIVDYAPPAPPFDVSKPIGASGYVVVRLPAGWDGIQHRTPRRQLCVVLRGTVEVTTSDGTSKRFSAGGCFVMEDVLGEGHATRNTGDGEAMVILVHLD
jgi:quercetin dioxygenase-like cupin family protein